MIRPAREVSARDLVDGYDVLFDEAMRAAHRGCLDLARTRGDGWPTPLDVLDFARLYGVSAAELGAFFGLILRSRRGVQVWIDAVRGPVHPLVDGSALSPGQAVALGWHRAAAEALN